MKQAFVVLGHGVEPSRMVLVPLLKETPPPTPSKNSLTHFDHVRTQNAHSLKPGRIFFAKLKTLLEL